MHMNFDPQNGPEPIIKFEDFLKLDIRIGTILECTDFPEAKKPSYKVVVDFGLAVGIRKSSAQITTQYTKESLIGKKVMAVVNFAPRKIGKFMSEVLILGFANTNHDVILASPDFDVPNGSRLH